MTDTRQTTIAEIITAHQMIVRAIGASLPSAWMSLDLSMAQLKTVMTLYHNGALPIGQIADQLGIGQPTASHLVDRLVQAQLVSRTEDALDRRRTLAKLLPKGEAMAEELTQLRLAKLQHWLEQLDDAALAAFHQGSQALAAVSTTETLQGA